MNFKIEKISEQLGNEYYPVGDKGPQLGGNVDQESEVAEESNDDMEVNDMENYTPGTDNIVVDKMSSNILAELNKIAILLNSGFAYDLIKITIKNIENISIDKT